MKKFLILLAVMWAAPSHAQTPVTVPGVEISGQIAPAIQHLDNSSDSSKLTEYRDLRDDFFVPSITFSARDRQNGWLFDLSGANVSRNDQTILARLHRPGAWSIRADWNEIPHNFSNEALTPYIQRSPGVFGVPATVPITFKKLATGAADAASVVASDDLIAAYQRTFLTPTPLETQTRTGRLAFDWSREGAISLGVLYDRRQKDGLKATYGPIGDRPPRTLNIQLTEPVDYATNDITLSAEHHGRGYQLRGEYLLSDFGNAIDTLRWQNVYTTAAPGADFDVWDRLVATYGQRPLSPDNRYQNASANAGVDLPGDARLTGSVSYGRLEQDATLLPYATHVSALANPNLPRATADAAINTVNLAADYVASPVPRLNVRAFVRRYDLNNETPSSRWQYVTSDTTALNGGVTYVNKRVSIPYEWDRLNAGAEAILRLPSRSHVTFALEREEVTRRHREANTAENVFRASWRARPAAAVSLQARYTHGIRNGSEYNYEVTRESYWYTATEANDNNNPAFTFDNHPDMRRFDVSDRRRRQADLTVNVTKAEVVGMSAFVRYRDDDFASEVAPSQPLLGTTFADRGASTPGIQLGRLADNRLRYGVDLLVQPNTRVMLNVFVNRDLGESLQRGLEFNENNKANPSAIATATLGPWTRAGSQWTAETEDKTWTGGLNATFQLVPDRLTVFADYTTSLAAIDLAYGGYGIVNWDGTPLPPNHDFAFSSPPTVREDLHVASLGFEVPIRTVVLVVSYRYERYRLEDWQQDSDMPWVEAVGADTLLRDSSRSFQWGNRLFNLGTYLAPSYDAHVAFVGFRYRF